MEPDQPVVRQFLDENLDALYNADERLGTMMLIFMICLDRPSVREKAIPLSLVMKKH